MHAIDPLSSDDEAALCRRLFELRWGGGFQCRACGHATASQLRSRPRVWSCNRCRCQHSVTAGTTLHRCKVPLGKVFEAARLSARKQSISGRALERALGLAHETAWSLLHRLRAGLARRPTELHGDVYAGEGAVLLRDLGWTRHRVFVIGTDLAGRVRWRLTTDRWFELIEMAGRPADRFVGYHPTGMWIETVVRMVHRGVSVRWLGRYVGALAGVHTICAERLDAAGAVLASALATPSRGFAADQRPHRNGWPDVWDTAPDEEARPVRLDDGPLPFTLYQLVRLRRGRLWPLVPDPDHPILRRRR